MAKRCSGILLHPTSLPGGSGIGDLGRAAYEFVDFLAAAGQKLWQVLPLGPTGWGNSPYNSYSAIAGNPLLIDLYRFVDRGLLTEEEAQLGLPSELVDFERVVPQKNQRLRTAFQRFRTGENCELQRLFREFCEVEASWLDDYTLFAALLEQYQGMLWTEWPAAIARRQPEAIAAVRTELAEEVLYHQFLQFEFFDQWQRLRRYANERGVQIVGDIPIYVAHNSVDVWAYPENFQVDPKTLTVMQMAGVPPDFFSATGQLWGNPVYNWDYLATTGFAWWVNRFRFLLRFVDWVRIDHFRGFAAYWQVPAGETTAINGEWVTAPGAEFFEVLQQELGDLPILAEDLGVITPDVEELRDRFDFPGMLVLLFAFGGDRQNPYLPHNHRRRAVVYTGTHDNDTAVGWWLRASRAEREFLIEYLGLTDQRPHAENIHWRLIQQAMASVAEMAIFPLQDVLGLDNSARMNRPGFATNNWTWRYRSHEELQAVSDRLRWLTELYGRV
ncbi:MAG: 4-alpha-glucanotransferase [Pseudanabaenaceae cyanobacterium]